MVATQKEVLQAIEQYFNIQQMAKQLLNQMPGIEIELEKGILAPEKLEIGVEEPPVTRLVDSIVTEGINSRASDIHFDPQDPEMRLRYRIDGILHDIMTIPKRIESAIISRIKILADMDITEHRRPQDGHISLKINNKEYDLRVASFATIAGEKIEIRILDKSSMLLSLIGLGLSSNDLDKFNALISKNYGIILVTGPTGSGKTTTLYAALNQMDKLAKNIITIEDPVEYKLDGINQAQVNSLAGITFATGLRSILRQDPDIVMVGEIRDLETAEIAIHSALTGHLVFSTLHTNDAPSAITRLIDMGIEPFLVSSSLIGVVAQRLIRIICPECKEEYRPDDTLLQELGLNRQERDYVFSRGRGCAYCFNSGYRGRAGIFEIMNVSEAIRGLIVTRQPASKIKETAMREGMHTLRQSAIQKVIEKVSAPDEVKRVIFIKEE
jgi:type IV pilus assembly protein PilB